MFAEKREFRRIKIACKISFNFSGRELVLNSHTEDLSAGGLMVILGEEIALSAVAGLELSLWYDQAPIKCKGEVAWVNEITPKETNPRLFNTGIKFVDISDSDREKISNFVNNIISTWQQ